MTALALDYTYEYLHGSQLDQAAGGLKLATFSAGEEPHPYFFEGQLARPKQLADMLRSLMTVVHTRFHVPPAMLTRILAMADPIVTCSDDRLRFEGFSSCCGVYARVDLLPESLHGERFGRGTTNVDFNQPMLSALSAIRDTDDVQLSVGTDRVELCRKGESVIEKKVKLPVRWLKGLVEVQACQSRMRLVHEIAAIEARRFLRSLPRMKTNRRATWIVAAGRGLRLSQCDTRGGVRVGGLERLRVLEHLASKAKKLKIYADDATGASGWELVFDDAHFHLVISPEVWRGFSGEGQALESLASDSWKTAMPKVQAGLRWSAVVDIDELVSLSGLDNNSVQSALAALGSRGLVGFDVGESSYFHRELPFDMDQVDQLQPRLRSARKLVDANRVRLVAADDGIEAFVASSDVEHRVRMTERDARCTCPWYAKHADTRGPCKHILATRIVLEEQERD